MTPRTAIGGRLDRWIHPATQPGQRDITTGRGRHAAPNPDHDTAVMLLSALAGGLVGLAAAIWLIAAADVSGWWWRVPIGLAGYTAGQLVGPLLAAWVRRR